MVARLMDGLGGTGEVRVDIDAIEVADDQQRRVAEVVAVEQRLAVDIG